MNFSIRAKLIGTFSLIIAGMAIVGWRGIAGMQEINQALNDMYTTDFVPARTVANANIALIEWNRAMVNHVLESTDAEMDKRREIMDRHKRILVTRLEALTAMENLSQKGRGLVQSLSEQLAQAEPPKESILKLSREGKRAEAERILQEELRPIIDQLDAGMSAFLALQENQADANMVATDERYAQGLARILWIIGISLVGSLLIAYFLASGISTSVNEMVRVADGIASGDLSVEVRTEGKGDEIGDLARSFGQIIDSSQEMAGVADRIASGDLKVEVKPRSERDVLGKALADMVANLRQQIGGIVEGANVLSSSTSEILASTRQLASSAAETATSVNETTTTVEEVRQTVELASQKAGEVSAGAQQVVQTAQSGRQATDQTLQGMNQTQTQMEAIAESVVRLSEQSQTVGQIITTVDDLAEQSNLLAVNASIEAARAGEEGKSFGVVAEEIRSLAEQSKQSTLQVRSILSEIQQATSAAVMAAEQGSKTVALGVSQAGEAGEAIGALAESVSESSQAALQIAASSQQQLAGMDQIVGAMESIREASTQNASSTQQVETSALNLDEVGQRLKELVSQYQTG